MAALSKIHPLALLAENIRPADHFQTAIDREYIRNLALSRCLQRGSKTRARNAQATWRVLCKT